MSTLDYNKFCVRTDYGNGTCIWHTPWAQIPVVAKALCEDGVLRTIRLNARILPLSGRTTFPKKQTMTGFLEVKDGTLHFIINLKG